MSDNQKQHEAKFSPQDTTWKDVLTIDRDWIDYTLIDFFISFLISHYKIYLLYKNIQKN